MSSKMLRPSLVITATLLGNTLEWFEYLTFAFLAPVFAKVFFPQLDSWSALSHTLMGFFFGYLLRPLGGLFFGFIGDRYGRKTALIASILLMSFPTLAIGFLPTYAQVGSAAIALLLGMRLLQGVATGGEFPSSMTFLVESARPEARGLYGSFAYTGMICGILLGSLDYFLLNHFFSSSLYTWGWRVAYLFGGLLGGLAFFLRLKLHETHSFQELKETHEVLKHPIHTLVQKYKSGILQLFGIQILQTISFNLFISFSIIYYSQVLHLKEMNASTLNLVVLFTALIALPLSGLLANRIGAKKIMLWAAWCHFLFAIPFYWMLQTPGYRCFALIGAGLMLSFFMGPSIALICTLFPAKVRLSGISLGYNLCVSFIGAISPLAALALIHLTNFTLAPAFLIMAAALITLLSLRTVRHP